MSQADLYAHHTDIVLRDIIQAVYQCLNLDDVFQEIVSALGQYLKADRCFITRFNEETGILSPPTKEYRSSQHISSMLEAAPELWTTLAELAKKVSKQNTPVAFHDIADLSPTVLEQLRNIEVQSGLACVIRFQGSCRAVLFIHQVTEKRDWTASEKEIVHLVAVQSAVAIHHAELYEESQTQAQRHALINQLYKNAIKGESVEALFDESLGALCRALDATVCKLIEWTDDPEKPYVFRAVQGANPDLVGRSFDAEWVPHAHFTLETQEPVVVEDFYQEKRFGPSPLHFEYGLVSGISAVVYGKETPFGVILADSREKRSYSINDVYLIQAIARTIGLVVERKRYENDLREYQSKLEQSNNELKQFAMIASHDLKSPLRKITTMIGALQRGDAEKLSTEGKDYLSRINKTAEKLQMLVDHLLTLSKVEHQEEPFSQFDLNEVVAQVVIDLEELKQEVQGTVKVEGLCTVQGDALQMGQLFQNLLENALKFHRDGVPPVVEIRANTEQADQCVITIRDNGIGIPPENLERIFDLFEHLPPGEQLYSGTGIGLAVVKKILERHQGTIFVESVLGQGTVFTISLPQKILI